MSKICNNCGHIIDDDNIQFCPKCGNQFGTSTTYKSGTLIISKLIMIIECILYPIIPLSFFNFSSSSFRLFLHYYPIIPFLIFVPLLWLIPMTIKIFIRDKNDVKFSMAFKILVLLFASKIVGILLLCDDNL